MNEFFYINFLLAVVVMLCDAEADADDDGKLFFQLTFLFFLTIS